MIRKRVTLDEKIFLITKFQLLLWGKFGKFNMEQASDIAKELTDLVEQRYLTMSTKSK